jgi:hypothetical protein
MTTINSWAVELSTSGCNAKNSLRTTHSGGNEVMMEAWFPEASLPRSNLSGGFSPIGRKILWFLAGAAAVGCATGLRK